MKSIVLSKFIAGFSTIAPPLAGAVGVGRGRFLVFAGLSALLWAGSAVGVGYLLHDSVESLLESLEGYGTGALVLLAAALVLFVAYKWLQRWRFQQGLRMARIEVDELRKRIQEGRATVIVDVRTEAGLRADPRRIPGAITMNLSDLDAKIGRVPPESELVLYCT
jgi:hypothetical protein